MTNTCEHITHSCLCRHKYVQHCSHVHTTPDKRVSEAPLRLRILAGPPRRVAAGSMPAQKLHGWGGGGDGGGGGGGDGEGDGDGGEGKRGDCLRGEGKYSHCRVTLQQLLEEHPQS